MKSDKRSQISSLPAKLLKTRESWSRYRLGFETALESIFPKFWGSCKAHVGACRGSGHPVARSPFPVHGSALSSSSYCRMRERKKGSNQNLGTWAPCRTISRIVFANIFWR